MNRRITPMPVCRSHLRHGTPQGLLGAEQRLLDMSGPGDAGHSSYDQQGASVSFSWTPKI